MSQCELDSTACREQSDLRLAYRGDCGKLYNPTIIANERFLNILQFIYWIRHVRFTLFNRVTVRIKFTLLKY